jgi:hypothetical protein
LDLGEDLISLECLVLNAITLVRCWKLENLDDLECGGGWGIYSPNHQKWPLGGCLSYSAPDSPVRHRTLSGAPATSVGRWVLAVGALTGGASGLSGGAPDRSCRLSGAPSARALTLARTVAHSMRLQSTVGAK